VRDGTGGQSLALANFPVTAVLSLTIDGLAIPSAPADGGWDAGTDAGGHGLLLYH